MDINGIGALIETELGKGAITGSDTEAIQPYMVVAKEKIATICLLLHDHERTYFDQLSCITGIDNGLEAGTMDVIYNLYSIPYETPLMLKVVLSRDTSDGTIPSVPTLTHIWGCAAWLERETYDLLGIHFDGHPDLRRILLPADWNGHPLRKDYELQEYYHGIKVRY